MNFEPLGATQAVVSDWSDDSGNPQRVIDAEVISTPGPPPPADNPWPDALPEAEWDRSPTPVASCVVLLHDLPSQCYDLLTPSLFLDPPPDARIAYWNIGELSTSSPSGCDFQPGCRYAYDRGLIDGFYLVAEGSDTRVVICGMDCKQHKVGGFTLSSPTNPTCPR